MRDVRAKMLRVFQKTAALCTCNNVARFVELSNPEITGIQPNEGAYVHESPYRCQFLKSEGPVATGEQFTLAGGTWEIGQAIGEDDVVMMFHAHQVHTWT